MSRRHKPMPPGNNEADLLYVVAVLLFVATPIFLAVMGA